MKFVVVITSLLLVLALGFVADDLAFATHTEPVKLVLNKDTFEFGETLIVTATLPEPWSNAKPIYFQSYFKPGYPIVISPQNWFLTGANFNGTETLYFKLNSTTLKIGDYKIKTYFEDALFSSETGRFEYARHQAFQWYNFTLTSDHDSTVLENKNKVKTFDKMIQSNTQQLKIQQAELTLNNSTITTINDYFTNFKLQIKSLTKQLEDQDKLIQDIYKELTDLNKKVDDKN